MNRLSLFLLTSLLVFSCGDKHSDATRDSVKDTTSSSESNTVEAPGQTPTVAPKVFWFDYTEKKTSGDEPVVMGKDEAIETLKSLPPSYGSFFGVDVGTNGVVQFVYNEQKVLMLDIPDAVAMESFQKEITMDEAVKIIGDVYEGKSGADVKEMMK